MSARPLFLAGALALSVLAPPAPAAVPARVRTTLPNGLVVILQPSRRLPIVDFRLEARAGAVEDPAGKEGLASLTAALMTQGAGRRGAQQVAEAIEFVGGELDCSSGTETIAASCEVLRKDFATGLELLRDVVVSPAFSAGEFARQRDEALGAIASNRADPSAIADEAFADFLWGGGPLGHPGLGTEASVKALTRDDVVAFHRRCVTPDRAVLVVVGDIDTTAALAAVRTAFAAWQPSGTPFAEPYAAPAPVRGRAVRVIDKPEATQAQIRIGCVAVPRNHPDWYALEVANTILGGGFTSRLVNSLRVDQGLVYSVGSGFAGWRRAGAFELVTFTRNEMLRKCVDAALAEVRKLAADGPTTAELDKAKRYLAAQYPIGLQGAGAKAAELAGIERLGLDPRTMETYGERVRSVTMDDVRRVSKQWFRTEDLRMVVVTQGAVGKAALAGLGPVEVRPIP